MTKKVKDYNNLKDFNKWIIETFDWIEPRAKALMKRAWCARGKYERKKSTPNKKKGE